jgi:hypothetical protein
MACRRSPRMNVSACKFFEKTSASMESADDAIGESESGDVSAIVDIEEDREWGLRLVRGSVEGGLAGWGE